jgi:hypothetical protein
VEVAAMKKPVLLVCASGDPSLLRLDDGERQYVVVQGNMRVKAATEGMTREQLREFIRSSCDVLEPDEL